MPAIIGNDDDGDDTDDSEHGSDFGSIMSEALSVPSSICSESDRVVTPFAPFHPEIPLVRTRVLEELTERMQVPYPSEPSSRRCPNAKKAATHITSVFDSREALKTATQYFTSNAARMQSKGSPSKCAAFDPNNEEKMVCRYDNGDFDHLLGGYEDETHRLHHEEDEVSTSFERRGVPERLPRPHAVWYRNEKKDLSIEKRSVSGSKRPKPKDDADRVYCEEIGEFDVLLGRGPQIYLHEGNQRFHEMKQRIQPQYLEAPKDGKIGISQSLVDAIHALGGRFLKYDDATGMWYIVLNRVAREKAAQALRETFTKEERQKKRFKYKKPNNRIRHEDLRAG